MRRFLNILLAFREYFLLVLFLVISIVLLANNDNRQIRALRSYTVGLLGFVQDAVSVVPNIFTLEAENAVLRDMNVDLADEVSRLREYRIENSQLRALLGLREEIPFKHVAAEVVGKSLLLMRNTITLDKGSEDGIAPDMPLISERGLVGKIISTGGGYSLGQLLYNKDFRASAKVRRTRVDGIIEWDGGTNLLLTNVPKTQDVSVGDIVVTSEYSSVFPRNITIGIVSDVKQREGSLFHEISVRPAVDFTTMEQVFVITDPVDSARVTLESASPAGRK